MSWRVHLYMRILVFILILGSLTLIAASFSNNDSSNRLRRIYSSDPTAWPKPNINKAVAWKELGSLYDSPVDLGNDSIRKLVELGKTLFFDTRLSGAGKISCGSCHRPELNWTDGKARSSGHNDLLNKRNSPSLQNVWFFERLFWDGRASSLEDQAFAPINSESEMAHDMRELPRQLSRITGYKTAFNKAYGDDAITPDRIATALAVFQRTIVSRKSRFDIFLQGDKKILTDAEIRGLHIFRTKAGCMNCHNGPLFTDNQFHNNGFAGNDKGVYQRTHLDSDIGKMKTPSLRDVMKTGPWMHDGSFTDIGQVISKYNEPENINNIDPLIRKLKLSSRDIKDLIAFLQSISSEPLPFQFPQLP